MAVATLQESNLILQGSSAALAKVRTKSFTIKDRDSDFSKNKKNTYEVQAR